MPAPANLTDDELLRMYGDVFDRDPATLELARRFDGAIHDESLDVFYVERLEEQLRDARNRLLELVQAPTDPGALKKAREFLGLKDDAH